MGEPEALREAAEADLGLLADCDRPGTRGEVEQPKPVPIRLHGAGSEMVPGSNGTLCSRGGGALENR